MRRQFAKLLLAAAALVAIPGAAEAGGPRAYGHRSGTQLTITFGTVATSHHYTERRHYHRPVVRRHYRPVPPRHYYPWRPYRPAIVVRPRPIIYAAPAVATAPVAVAPGRQCREYITTVMIGGQLQQAYGTACLTPDGDWEKID